MSIGRHRKTALAALLALTLLTLPGLCRADGQGRPATRAEAAFHRAVMNVLKTSLPVPPEGWEVLQNTDIEELKVVAEGAENTPLPLAYRVEWTNSPRKAEMEAHRERAIAAMAAQPARAEPDPALLARYEALSIEAGRAAERGEMAKMENLHKELEIVADKLRAAMAGHDAQFTKMMQETAKDDIGALITIQVNTYGSPFLGVPHREPPLGDITQVYRTRREQDYQGDLDKEGASYVFLGKPWRVVKAEGELYLQAEEPAPSPHTAVYTLVVTVQAQDARARHILEGMNWNALKGLLKN